MYFEFPCTWLEDTKGAVGLSMKDPNPSLTSLVIFFNSVANAAPCADTVSCRQQIKITVFDMVSALN